MSVQPRLELELELEPVRLPPMQVKQESMVLVAAVGVLLRQKVVVVRVTFRLKQSVSHQLLVHH